MARSKAITVRNLPPEVQRAVRDRARKDRTSLNRAVGALLEEAAGRSAAGKPLRIRHHDFDKFSGRWRAAEARAFAAALREQRRIDPGDWQ